MTLQKDMALDRLAEWGNVAQFVAFRPTNAGLDQSTARIVGMAPNARFASIGDAVAALLRSSGEASVNIRSYHPDDPRSREFVYGIRSIEEVLAHIARLAGEGLHLIVNETIDVCDGGVSGVAQGEIIEFSPDDTPRAVEKPDVASLPRDLGLALLETVYGFAPELPPTRDARVEFSLHPAVRGWRQTHTLLWEIEPGADARLSPRPAWPNRFSRHIGDKCFGLLIAEQMGAAVPRTLTVARRVAPFAFGRDTGSHEIWIRTCPVEPQPGLFTTAKGWLDPFRLLAQEDSDSEIASVLSQAAIRARWSGAAIVTADETLVIEGTTGEGDAFMLGTRHAEPLPPQVVADVQRAHVDLSERLGPVRIEWVHDGAQLWIVQLHIGATRSRAAMLVDGDAQNWHRFDVSLGLSALREFVKSVPAGEGLFLQGDVGLTSHIADVVRKWGGPARIERA